MRSPRSTAAWCAAERRRCTARRPRSSTTARGVYAGLPQPFTATRYHSLVVDDELPRELELSAWTEDGVVMGIRHRTLPVEGVQFHPESVLTPDGPALLANFLTMIPADGRATDAPMKEC